MNCSFIYTFLIMAVLNHFFLWVLYLVLEKSDLWLIQHSGKTDIYPRGIQVLSTVCPIH